MIIRGRYQEMNAGLTKMKAITEEGDDKGVLEWETNVNGM